MSVVSESLYCIVMFVRPLKQPLLRLSHPQSSGRPRVSAAVVREPLFSLVTNELCSKSSAIWKDMQGGKGHVVIFVSALLEGLEWPCAFDGLAPFAQRRRRFTHSP